MRPYEIFLTEAIGLKSAEQRYGKKIEQKKQKDHLAKNLSFEDIFNKIEETDLSNDKKYTPWLLQNYSNDGIRLIEDLPRATEALKIYMKLGDTKRLEGNQKDIFSFKSLNDLEKLTDQFKADDIRSGKEQKKELLDDLKKSGDVDIIYNGSDGYVVKILSEKASCALYGNQTKWCVSSKKNNEFNDFSSRSQMIVLYDKKLNEKFAMFRNSNQYMNSKDVRIDIGTLIRINKKLIEIAAKTMKFNNINELYVSIQGDMLFRLNNYNIELIKIALNQDPFVIKKIKNPIEELQLFAVNTNPLSLKYIKSPSEKTQIEALYWNGDVIQYINNPSEKVQLAAVRTSASSIIYIKDAAFSVQKYVIDISKGVLIRAIKNPYKEISMAAVKYHAYNIKYIKNPDKELQLMAVNQEQRAILYIKMPSEEIQLASVKRFPYSILYIKNPSEKLQIAAVRGDNHVIDELPNPSDAVKRAGGLML